MGFLSKIAKPFKKIWKGVKKVAKKAWKGVKKFASSTIGKIIIAAVIIYFTAGAGAGLLAGGGSAGAGVAGTTVAGGAMSTVPASIAATFPAATGTGIATAATPALAGGVATTAATVAPAVAPAVVPAVVPPVAGEGLISTIGSGIKTAGSWMAANPLPTMVGGQMLSAAFTPSAAEEQAELEEQRRLNSNIAGVSGSGEGAPISLGLIQQAQQQDLAAPTYTPGGKNG